MAQSGVANIGLRTLLINATVCEVGSNKVGSHKASVSLHFKLSSSFGLDKHRRVTQFHAQWVEILSEYSNANFNYNSDSDSDSDSDSSSNSDSNSVSSF